MAQLCWLETVSREAGTQVVHSRLPKLRRRSCEFKEAKVARFTMQPIGDERATEREKLSMVMPP